MDNFDDKALLWTPQKEETLLETPVFTVKGVDSRSPRGDVRRYVVIDGADWVTVVPALPSGNLVMVRQWRHGENRVNVEFPGGVMNAGETPEAAARRELLEETGYTAGKLTPLGAFSPNPALMTNRQHFFLAEELSGPKPLRLDDDEYLSPLILPPETVWQKMQSGEYSHGLMIAGAFLYLRHLGNPDTNPSN